MDNAEPNLLITPVDRQAQEEGTWTEYHGVKLKIARATNAKFRRAMIAQRTNFDPEDQSEEADRESTEKLATAMAEGLLLDWKNHPAQVPYSKESARTLLIQDSDARQFVLNFANQVGNFYADRVRKTLEK